MPGTTIGNFATNWVSPLQDTLDLDVQIVVHDPTGAIDEITYNLWKVMETDGKDSAEVIVFSQTQMPILTTSSLMST